MSTFQQAQLDKIAVRLEVIQFHGIYCDCERCLEQQKKEKAERDAFGRVSGEK